MSNVVWGWAAAWLAARLWLEWQVDRHWLPGTGEVREDYTGWRVPPPDALTHEGERLWRLRYQVTVWGFLGWVALVIAWILA